MSGEQDRFPIRYIPVSELHPLEGNPRHIKDPRFKILMESVRRNPDFFHDRPCLVNNTSGKLVIYAGNMRFRAAVKLGLEEVPCIVRSLTDEQQKELTIIDNVELGEWDYDSLANDWDPDQLADWGLEVDGYVPEESEIQPEIPFTEELLEEHNYVVLFFKNEVDWLQARTLLELKTVRDTNITMKGRQGIGRVLDGAKAIEKIRGK